MAPPPLREFWGQFADTNRHGFEVHKYAEITDNPPSPELVYVVLPDMHLPAIPHKEEFKGRNKEVHRTGWKGDRKVFEEHYVPVIRREELGRYAEYRLGKDADIFMGAGESLCVFLDWVQILATGKLDGKLKIIQVGDMYELWQAMGEWSSYFDGDPPNLVLEKGSQPKLCARGQGIEDQNSRLMFRFKQLDQLGVTRYIYGNHDVYLCEKIREKATVGWPKTGKHECWVKRPSEAVKAKLHGGGIIGVYRDWKHAEAEKEVDNVWGGVAENTFECWVKKRSKAVNVKTHVHDGENGIIGVYSTERDALYDNDPWYRFLSDRAPRKTHFLENGMFVEHGHRLDDFNQDGKWAGPFITELVYFFPALRWLDPDRRDQYHRLVGIDYYYRRLFRQPCFSTFVMGHTHVPDLSVIEIYRKPGEIPGSFCLDCQPKDSETYRRYKK